MANIEEAITVLEQHISSIHTVPEWADKMGSNSPDYFSRKIRDHFGKRPKELIVEARLKKVKECLRKSNGEIYFCIARDLGFVNDTALYKFVKWHTGKSLTELKMESENGV